MIIRELTAKEALAMLREYGLSASLPYRGYAVTLRDDGVRRLFIGHSPERKYLLQDIKSDLPKHCLRDDGSYAGETC